MTTTAAPYTLSLVTGPTAEPLSVAETRVHLRVESTDDDGLITDLIQAAREHVEMFTDRALLTQTWDVSFDGFPVEGSPNGPLDARSLWLPKAPLVSVTSVTYKDGAGATQTWSTSNYTVDAPAGARAQRGRVVANYGVPYPVTYYVPNAVTVRFVAGYGGASSVPASLKAAMKLLIGHWYDNRASVVVSEGRATLLEIPQAVDALLWPYKAF